MDNGTRVGNVYFMAHAMLQMNITRLKCAEGAVYKQWHTCGHSLAAEIDSFLKLVSPALTHV